MQHSRYVAQAAEAVAGAHPRLDADSAYVLGLLHDIGRREGTASLRHIIDGYNFLHEKGFDDAARICITHSFPIVDINAAAGQWDCTQDELEFVTEFLYGIDFTEYDRLIQLCDALAMSSGFCLIEKRMVDVAMRHGVNEYTIPRWKARMQIKEKFEKEIGGSVYRLLPGVVENTFGFDPCEPSNRL